MRCHSILQGIFLTQELNPCLLLGRQILYHWATWEAHMYVYIKTIISLDFKKSHKLKTITSYSFKWQSSSVPPLEMPGRNKALTRARVARKMLLALDSLAHRSWGRGEGLADMPRGAPRLLPPQSVQGRQVTREVLRAAKEAKPWRWTLKPQGKINSPLIQPPHPVPRGSSRTFQYLFFPFIFISWRLITLQHCSDFCHTFTWVSHGFTCVPHPDPPNLCQWRDKLGPHLLEGYLCSPRGSLFAQGLSKKLTWKRRLIASM